MLSELSKTEQNRLAKLNAIFGEYRDELLIGVICYKVVARYVPTLNVTIDIQ